MITDYFQLHHGISSKYLNEYLALIAYKCMNKLLDVESGLIELAKCNCTTRWKNYVHRSNVVLITHILSNIAEKKELIQESITSGSDGLWNIFIY